MANQDTSNKVLEFHQLAQTDTYLSRICGTDRLFRDRYRIHRLLGRGGFGVTFLAEDISNSQSPWCAIKQLCPKAKNATALARARRYFKREAKILSQLGAHANIPQMVDYFEEDGEFYLVQEFIEGRTLSRDIRHHGQYSEALVKSFLREILPILEFVHEQGAIHRDIKPSNIIRRRKIRKASEGSLVLIDFGAVKEVVRQTEGDRTMTTTASTAFVGTFEFSPPEQLAMRPTYASDIYALGITCAYLLAGKGALQNDLPHFRDKQWWRQTVDVSDEFAEILDRMVAVDLRERYSSAREVLVALNSSTLGLETLENSPLERSHPEPAAVETDSYVSPVQRRARAIRARMDRLHQHQKRSNLHLYQPWQ
ncbi:serine/threonine-protein kinase [Roseofilum casamattae]|uniref:non-specific serine/threonine protein kinase n=1 Tax=Roseofilum casamattae BLCC-M143 TaxID=3022442 RepID=A0ABT7BV62_9CYAN|nr:serine/threonine-protein kinase [Roseofilum casamattae]MDJ1183086.1 serine/threonine-protein kinase [Roseofilum casamattae BLCC-M143]